LNSPSPAEVSTFQVVIGAAYRLLVRLRTAFMQIWLYCIEEYRAGARDMRERKVARSIDVMDGGPARGDNMPIRFFFGDCGTWPFNEFAGSSLNVEW
jgi:vacuolar protein sorting-associated protein 26